MCPYLYGTLLFEKFTEQSKLTSELKLHSNTIANITYINTFNNKIQNKESLRALKRDLNIRQICLLQVIRIFLSLFYTYFNSLN